MPDSGEHGRDPQARQDVSADGDAYIAGRDQIIYNFFSAVEQSQVLRSAWGNIPARNPGFVGRDNLLSALREGLTSGGRATVQALRGMGGVGKTQLSAEYAHRYANEYDVVWWIAAEQSTLIPEQFAALAEAMGCAETGAVTTVARMRTRVLGELRRRERWLLVFDNAEDPEDIAYWLPGGAGHVLITSRTGSWDEVAVPVEVDVLERQESITLLRRRVSGLDTAGANLVATALGDLPLALAQAASYLAPAGISADEYVKLVEARAAEILDIGRPLSYPRSLVAVTQLALDHLESVDPAAAKTIRICAFLASEPIPAAWFTNASERLPQPLSAVATDPLAWRHVLARITSEALARIDQQGLLMHRLTQAIIRTLLSSDDATTMQTAAVALLTQNYPGDFQLPSNWPEWAQLLPHMLALDPDTSITELSDLAYGAAWYLNHRGLTRAAHEVASRLFQSRLSQDGADAPSTLRAAHALASVLLRAGRYGDARVLFDDVIARRRQTLGDDHPDTLKAAVNLAVCLQRLGDLRAARELNEDTVLRLRRVLGEDHPETFIPTANLATNLRELGELQAARELNEDTVLRLRRVLGEDHPATLGSAINLANDLRHLGEYQAARVLREETLSRLRRVFGEDHFETLNCVSGLAGDLRELEDYRAARQLDEAVLIRRYRILGDDHPSTLSSANNLAVDLRALGEYQVARQLDEAVLAGRRRILGENHPLTLNSARNLADDLDALSKAVSDSKIPLPP